MIKNERQDKLLEMLKERKYCSVNYLAQRLFVAPATVRRDLDFLEKQGLLTRCFGGATVPQYENREIPFAVRDKANLSEKRELAKRAYRLIKTGDAVFLDASTTVSHIARLLLPEQELTVMTNSTQSAALLRERHIRCYLTGGLLVENSHALVGSIAEGSVADFHANLCFFSSDGIDENGVISDPSEAETALRRCMLKNADRQYFLCDSSKCGKRFPFRVCCAEDITDVIK